MSAIYDLLNGKLVDSKELEKETGLSFGQLMSCSKLILEREVKWNPSPLNGQYIETKFRLR